MRNQKVSQAYLMAVPLWVLVVAFAFGHLNPSVYLPIWIIHGVLMVLCVLALTGSFFNRNAGTQIRYIAGSSLLVITAWIFISIFFGFGPPPETPSLWVDRSAEQTVRYGILIFAGILITLSFSILREALKEAGENFYSRIGFTIFLIAMPLYILNMAFWGCFLTAAFKTFISTQSTIRPDWYDPVRALFGEISTVEVALIYLGTIAFICALKKTGWIKTGAFKLFLMISLIAVVLDLVPAGQWVPLKIAGYFVSIPAIPFVIPYLLAIQLLINLRSTVIDRPL